jgi:Rrf2 family protein
MAKFISISEAASLAIHSMALIAAGEHKLNVNQIAEITGSSRNHLAKVLQTLVKCDFLVSNRGPKGGFGLKRSADQISLFEIYQLMEGIIDRNHCGLHNNPCPFEECIFGGMTRKFTNCFVDYLKNNKLSEVKYKTVQ